ncbi:MAG: hypothetical protein IPK82_40260 [Polyangiaceae bacterium]|nr:hypothetical protein [Polyangiaceae bacterium]
MSATNSKQMEEALQAAVARMNRPEPSSAPAGSDPIAILAALLPKLIENRAEKSELVEKLDGLRNDELVPLRKQLRLIRVKLHEMAQAQGQLIEAVNQISEQQSAVNEAVLHLAGQVERIQVVAASDDFDDAPAVDERRAAPISRKAPAQAVKGPRGIKKQQRQ